MLVLSRRKDDSVVIDGNIRIKVLSIKGGQVRLGIEAPKHVPVHRKEVFDQLAREAAHGTTSDTCDAEFDQILPFESCRSLVIT